MVADEADLADAGLFAFVDGEDEIDAPVRQLNQPLGHARFVAAVFLVGVLDSADVALGGRLVVGGVRLRLHLDFELLRLDLLVALERDAIDDLLASASVTTILPFSTVGADLRIEPGRLQVVDAALDRRRIGPGEIGLERRGIDIGALDDDLLRVRRRRPAQPAQTKDHRQKEAADTPANPIHMAHSPSSRRRGDRHRAPLQRDPVCAPSMRLAAPVAGDAADATQLSTHPPGGGRKD